VNQQVSQVIEDALRLWAPPPKQKLSEWAEANFRLSPEYSAHSGPLKLYQFQREPLDAFTDPYVRHIVAMTSTQMLKTLLQQIAIAYVIARAPGPILAAQPTTSDAETFSKERLAPMIRDMECLRGRVSAEKKTSKDNCILHKSFPGGSLSLIGAQTAGDFARRSIRYFFADERDKWKENVGKEGDGFSLGVKRTSTFRSLAKIIEACSPTIEGRSQIARAYADSDQRKFWIPCPECGELQVLQWARVRFDTTNPMGTTKYYCVKCEHGFSDVARWDRCEQGVWRADKPFESTAGFWISELYSPWKKLGELAVDFLSKKDNPATLQTFINTSLAETWREPGEAPPDYEKLMNVKRADPYTLGTVPAGPLFLTAGVDVQKTWLEGYVWGWGADRHRWVIDWFRIEHSPFEPAAWVELDERLARTYSRADGTKFGIVRMCIDAGFAGNEVYNFARRHGSSRVMAVDGRETGRSIVDPPSLVVLTVSGRRIKRGCRLWPVNVSACKQELYANLNLPRPSKDADPLPAGWVHFPTDLPEEFYKQITAEEFRLSTRYSGVRKYHWEPIENRRSEALDAADYARAGAFSIGVDYLTPEQWKRLEEQAALKPPSIAHSGEAKTPTPAVSSPSPSAAEGSGSSTRGGPSVEQYFDERTKDWFS
jgi:phage terminase large subunit GpA-like protein